MWRSRLAHGPVWGRGRDVVARTVRGIGGRPQLGAHPPPRQERRQHHEDRRAGQARPRADRSPGRSRRTTPSTAAPSTGRLSELDEYAVEQAVRLVEGGLSGRDHLPHRGPGAGRDGLLKALAMGGDKGVHVLDDAIHGSDALATSLVLAKALEHIGFDLVLAGMASTDAEMSVVPAMVADRLGRQPGHLRRRAVRGRGDGLDHQGGRRGDRAGQRGAARCRVDHRPDRRGALPRLPGDHDWPRRSPSRPSRSPTSGSQPGSVGLAAAATRVRRVAPAPRAARPAPSSSTTAPAPRQLADFLVARQLL